MTTNKSAWITPVLWILALWVFATPAKAAPCNGLEGQPGFFLKTIESGGELREYMLYVNPQYKCNRPTPLVILLHGWSIPPDFVLWWTDMMAHADASKFILAVPTGRALWWNTTPQSDDVTFISDLIDAVSADYQVHSGRIFVAGLSMGGWLSHRLACDLSDRIAAIATVGSATFPDFDVWTPDNCEMTRPVPILEIHGTADVDVPYYGDVSIWGVYFAHSVPETWDMMAEFYSCSDEVEIVFDKKDVTCVERRGCAGDTTLRQCTVEGGGHSWPPVDLCVMMPDQCWWVGEYTTDTIDASREAWKFFAEHSMPEGCDE